MSFDRQVRLPLSLPRLTAVVLAALAVALLATSSARAAFSDYGLESVTASTSTTAAAAHPNFHLAFRVKTDPLSPVDAQGLNEPYARTRDITVKLPPGLIGNPNTVPKCTTPQFVSFTIGGQGCPQDTQVGVVELQLYSFNKTLTEPIFNMETPSNETVARLGFYAATLANYISVRVRSEGDYGLTATLEGLQANERLVSAKTELWGVPADPSHNTKRLTPEEAFPIGNSESPARVSGLAPEPFMTNPTACLGPLPIQIGADSYQEPGRFSFVENTMTGMSGCGDVEFKPTFSVLPTSREAGMPTGLDINLEVPQNESPYGRGTSQLRGATVTFPAGMTIAAGAADGLQACSSAQVHVGEDVPAECPNGSQIGTVEFDVPQLSRSLKGALFQRTPEPGNLFRVWLVTDELGVHVKIPGEVRVDKSSGQITSIFVDTPQVPLQELNIHLKSGSKGVLANPPSCGTHQTHFEFTPWSSNPPASGDTPMTIDQNCGAVAFSPQLQAGTISPSGGSYSPFTFDLIRKDREENVSGIEVTLPPGLTGKLAGIPLCSESQAAAGSCGAGSQVGTTTTAVGPGSTPLWVPQPGKEPTAVYLAGPYKGAPYSLVVRVPAQAGPFDLGTVVVRVALQVDPTTTQVTGQADPLPQILEGVPVSYRHIHLSIDRPELVLNPTSCDPMSIDARVTGSGGATAKPSVRFQAANCSRLGFKPKLALKLTGGTKRNAHPALRATLTMPPKGANIARAQVALPHSEFLDQAHIRTICTRVQFAAENCPKAAIYGRARAFTPLLDQPLEGPVYLRSSSNKLPDLVADLRGQVHIVLAGRIDSIGGGIRTTFPQVPDQPISKFVLSMQGGKKGLLVNSRDVCASVNKATVKMDGQNGKVHDFKTPLRASCGKKKSKKSKGK